MICTSHGVSEKWHSLETQSPERVFVKNVKSLAIVCACILPVRGIFCKNGYAQVICASHDVSEKLRSLETQWWPVRAFFVKT